MVVLSPRTVYAPGREPPKAEIIQLLEQIMGTSSAPAIVKLTKAALDLVTPASENYGGVVLNDPDPAKNGYYYRSAGTWVIGRGFPDTLARVALSGSGTAQTGVVNAGVNPATVEVFFAKVVTENTGAMTLSISGGAAKPVVNLAGNPLSAGEWTGMVLFYPNDFDQYQLLVDAGAAAAAAQSATDAGTARAGAELARDQAQAAASSVSPTEYPSIAAAAALTPVAAPDFIRTAGYAAAGDGGGALYKKAASEPSHTGKFSITLSDAVTVVWYEIAETIPNVLMFGATEADLYTGAQAALNYLAAVGGGSMRFPGGSYTLGTSLVCPADDATLLLDDNCTINHNTPDYMALQMQGARGVVRGGISGGFVGPAAWDPVDGSGSLPFAVIKFTGEKGRVERTRIFNIRRVGIQFKDVNNGIVEGCWIEGNQPYPTYPLLLTNLHGIHFDAGSEASWGNYRAINNTIKTVTQGIDLASYGGGGGSSGEAHGCVFTGNTFEDIWDHAIYTNYADGCVITGNNFSDCHIAVAASGPRHVISGNSFVSRGTTTLESHIPGISLRDPQYCVVSDNTFFGTTSANSPVHIDFRVLSADACFNVCANNTMRIAGGNSTAIRFSYLNDASRFIYDNIIEGNNITALGRSSVQGIIQIDGNPANSGVGNTGNIIRGNRISQIGAAPAVFLESCVATQIDGNTFKLSYGAPSAITLEAVQMSRCSQCVVSSNLYIVGPGQGANITYRGMRETTSASMNEVRNNRSYINTGAAGFSFSEFNPFSGSSKLLAIYGGTGAPGAAVRAGSQYTRYDGGAGTSFYVNEADGVNWVGK